MESHSLRTVVRRLRQVIAPAVASNDTDCELMRAFTSRRDAQAFEQIVRRHGPMVLGVCRRVLRDPADADDAFQATFLVLLRKAGSLRQPERLAGWLHQVANRTARKLRAIRLARSARHTELIDHPAGEPVADFVWRELRPIFDHELDELPEKLRLPAVLCFLEGHSKGEAARTLGWPEGTLSGRLQQARERLRMRLAARGLTLSTGALAVALFEGVGSAAVSDRLLRSTLQIVATGRAGAAATAGTWALADGVAQAMIMSKVKSLAAVVLVAGVMGSGAGLVMVPGSAVREVAADPQKETPPGRVADQPYDLREGRNSIEEAIRRAELNDDRVKAQLERLSAYRNQIRFLLKLHIESLCAESERIAPLVAKGILPKEEAERVQAELRATEQQLEKHAPVGAKDPDREALQAELETLKDRAAFEERMIKKGFLSESQLKKTRVEIVRVEEKLKKLDAPKAADPRRAILEEMIRDLERNVQIVEEARRKGTGTESEAIAARIRLNEHKLKLIDLSDRPATDPPADRAWADTTGEAKQRQAQIDLKSQQLARAERLLKENAVSAEEVQQLRTELNRLKAEAADAKGEYAAAVKLRETNVAELEQLLAATRRLVQRNVASRADLRAVEIALAEAKIAALKAGVRQQLAAVVDLRDQQLREARALFESRSISAEEMRRAEQALSEAKLRLAEAR